MCRRGETWLLLALFVVGCGPLPSAARPPPLPELVDAQRARFSTTAPPNLVRSKACALKSTFNVGEQTRAWTISFENVACRHGDDAGIPLHVHMEKGLRGVVLEAAADDIPEEALRDALSLAGGRLKDAIAHAQESDGTGKGAAAGAVGAGATVAGMVIAIVFVAGAVIAGFAALIVAFTKALP